MAGDADLPLCGKRVLVTSPRQYAGKLCGLLIEAGACAVSLPMIRIGRLTHPQAIEELDRQLRQLSSFTHVAFTSKNGISAVMSGLKQLYGSDEAAAEQLRTVSCWALGADAEMLRGYGLTVHTPPQASTRGMVQELVARGEADGARVLCPVPSVHVPLSEPPTVPNFLDALQAAGASVVRADAYETTTSADSYGAEIIHELQRQGDLAIAFTSIAEAQGLRYWLERAGSTRLAGGHGAMPCCGGHALVLAAHGPDTAAGAEAVLRGTSAGALEPVADHRRVDCISRDSATFQGLVHALEEVFAAHAAAREA